MDQREERVYVRRLDRDTLTSILKEHAMNDLDAQDRQALMKASRRLISGISLGALLGGSLAASLSFKGRYALKNLRSLPHLYPAHLNGSLDRQLAIEHLRFMLKTLFFFTGGVVAGAQLGGFVGLRSAQSIVRSEGNVDHINGAIQKTQDDLRRRSLAGNGRSQQQSGRANEAVAQPMDGENTPLAYQWHQEQQTNSFTEYQAPSTEVDLNAPPRSVAELLVASQQPMAQQDLPVYQQMLARISSLGSRAMALGWMSGVGLSLVGPWGLRWIRQRHGSFMFRPNMSKERRTALLKAQLGWGCKCSILSLFGLQAGANIGGEKALEKAWSESMSGLSSRGDGDEVKTRIQSTLRRARSNINPAIPVPKEDQYSIGQSPTSDQSTESDTQPQAKSRWEELRASKRPESAWERIRQQRPSAADIANEGTSTTGPGRNEESPKDQRIKDLESFQQMMEEERKGKDSFN